MKDYVVFLCGIALFFVVGVVLLLKVPSFRDVGGVLVIFSALLSGVLLQVRSDLKKKEKEETEKLLEAEK